MTIEQLLQSLAARIAAVSIPGIEGVSYPMRADVPVSGWIMLRQSEQFPTSYQTIRLGEQAVNAAVDIIILVKATKDEQRDQAKIDKLIDPVLDAIDPTAYEVSPAELLGLQAHQIDHVRTEAQITRRPVEWAGTPCYAAYISIDPQYRRKPKRMPMKGAQP